MTLDNHKCRSCGGNSLEIILDLGKTPLANALLTEENLGKNEDVYPLTLAYCKECHLVQILETVSADTLFREYLYFSSFSDTMLVHSKQLTESLVAEEKLGSSNLVVELASNDGYLLQYYQKNNIPVLGVEPARNIAEYAIKEKNIPTIPEFFGTDLAEKMVMDGQAADIIHAHNVLAHVPELNDFVKGISILLKENGIAVIEAPYLQDLLDNVEFDTIYHEHLCYYSLSALLKLFDRHGLQIHDIHRIPIHGGSLQIHASHKSSREIKSSVENLLNEEQERGLQKAETFRDFADKVRDVKLSLINTLEDLKNDGKVVAAYGASAKGSTLLNYCEINGTNLDFIVDRSTVKQGFYTPGSHLEVLATEELEKRFPDYCLLLTWNFADEILEQQKSYREKGGKFIIPLPEVKIV